MVTQLLFTDAGQVPPPAAPRLLLLPPPPAIVQTRRRFGDMLRFLGWEGHAGVRVLPSSGSLMSELGAPAAP